MRGKLKKILSEIGFIAFFVAYFILIVASIYIKNYYYRMNVFLFGTGILIFGGFYCWAQWKIAEGKEKAKSEYQWYIDQYLNYFGDKLSVYEVEFTTSSHTHAKLHKIKRMALDYEDVKRQIWDAFYDVDIKNIKQIRNE